MIFFTLKESQKFNERREDQGEENKGQKYKMIFETLQNPCFWKQECVVLTCFNVQFFKNQALCNLWSFERRKNLSQMTDSA